MVLDSPTKEKSELVRAQVWINAISCWCSLERPYRPRSRPSSQPGPLAARGAFLFHILSFFRWLGLGRGPSKYRHLRAPRGLFWCCCGRKAQKGAKRDHKWQEREDRVVNLQTVVLGMPGVSCDPQANIMVSMCVTRWEFW